MTTPRRTIPSEEVWTTRRLLAWMGEAFTKKGLDSPRLLAEMLVAHVLGCDRIRLYMEADRPATPLERSALRDLVQRALAHEPVQYLVGEAWFFALPFKVDRRVLIPRPSTETIVETVLQHERTRHQGTAPRGEGVLIADVCTGSGCIAVALLKNLPGARAVATDLSPDALDVARGNAQRHGVLDRLELLPGNLLEPLRDHPVAGGAGAVDYLVSNPPYIPDHEWDADFIRPLAAHAPTLVKPGGLLLIEVAAAHADEARALVDAAGVLTDVRVLKDVDGLPRVVVGHRAP